MGQRIGKAAFNEVARPFLNLPKDAVDDLWESFNDVAEGFGVDVEEMKEIFTILQEPLDMSKRPLAVITERLFRLFDTDSNELTDALELLATLAVVSGMTLIQKLDFVFRIYNFDESGELSIDELALAMKSTLTGLAKLTGTAPPIEADIELASHDAFARAQRDLAERVSRAEVVAFCRNHPDSRSWLGHHDDSADACDAANSDASAGAADPEPDEVMGELTVAERTAAEVAALDLPLFLATDLAKCVEADSERRGRAMGGDDGGDGEDLDDEFIAVVRPRPWLKTAELLAPAVAVSLDTRPPDLAVSLEWVHGFRGADVRNNVRYTHTGEIAFHAGSVGAVMDPVRRTQRFCLSAHREEIMCLAVHVSDSQSLVVTGEAGARPRIVVWDASTMAVIASARGLHRRGVAFVDFSPDGARVASCGLDDGHTVAVHAFAPAAPGVIASLTLVSALYRCVRPIIPECACAYALCVSVWWCAATATRFSTAGGRPRTASYPSACVTRACLTRPPSTAL